LLYNPGQRIIGLWDGRKAKKNQEFALKYHIFMKWAWAIIDYQAAAAIAGGIMET
jgi:hypothetical protein